MNSYDLRNLQEAYMDVYESAAGDVAEYIKFNFKSKTKRS